MTTPDNGLCSHRNCRHQAIAKVYEISRADPKRRAGRMVPKNLTGPSEEFSSSTGQSSEVSLRRIRKLPIPRHPAAAVSGHRRGLRRFPQGSSPHRQNSADAGSFVRVDAQRKLDLFRIVAGVAPIPSTSNPDGPCEKARHRQNPRLRGSDLRTGSPAAKAKDRP